MARTQKMTVKERTLAAFWCEWLERWIGPGKTFTEEECLGAVKHRLRLRNRPIDALQRYLAATMKPSVDTAFYYGEIIRGRVPHASALTGLYAAGYVADTLGILSALPACVSCEDRLTMAAAVPLATLCRHSLFERVEPARRPAEFTAWKTNATLAQEVCAALFERHGKYFEDAWRAWNPHRTNYDVSSAFFREHSLLDIDAVRSAITLESSGAYVPADVVAATFYRLFERRAPWTMGDRSVQLWRAFSSAQWPSVGAPPLLSRDDFVGILPGT